MKVRFFKEFTYKWFFFVTLIKKLPYFVSIEDGYHFVGGRIVADTKVVPLEQAQGDVRSEPVKPVVFFI